MALRTSSRMVSSRSSALFLGFSRVGLSLAGVVGGVVWAGSVFGVGGGWTVFSSGAMVVVGLIWLIFRSISSIFSWKLLRRSSLADSRSYRSTVFLWVSISPSTRFRSVLYR